MTILVFIVFCALLISCLASQECGKVKVGTAFSVGSEYAVRGQFPWLAPLFMAKGDEFFCGSTIISKRYLLTASHCVRNKGSSHQSQPSDIYALLGKFDLNNSSESGVIKAEIDSITIHSDWKPFEETYDADVAILKVKNEINFTNYIQPICLPQPFADAFDIEGSVAGYGLSDQSEIEHEIRPKYVKIVSVTQETCLFSHEIIPKISSMRMFCAGQYGKNPCRGDSGGGFYVKKGEIYTIQGIVSSSIHKECYDNQFVLFTNVPKFINWIKEEAPSDDYDDWILTPPVKCHSKVNPFDFLYECVFFEVIESTTPNVRVGQVDGAFTEGKSFTDVETIGIANSKVTFIPDMSAVINTFPNYYQFYIVICGLKYIERSKLAKMRHLRMLNFYGNEIEYFDSDVFDDLTNLELLAFVHNKIKVLPMNLLRNLANLKDFWSYHNPVEAIPMKFFQHNRKLENALLGPSSISKIRFNFKTLPSLKRLDLKSTDCIDGEACSNCTYSIATLQQKIDVQC